MLAQNRVTEEASEHKKKKCQKYSEEQPTREWEEQTKEGQKTNEQKKIRMSSDLYSWTQISPVWFRSGYNNVWFKMALPTPFFLERIEYKKMPQKCHGWMPLNQREIGEQKYKKKRKSMNSQRTDNNRMIFGWITMYIRFTSWAGCFSLSWFFVLN